MAGRGVAIALLCWGLTTAVVASQQAPPPPPPPPPVQLPPTEPTRMPIQGRDFLVFVNGAPQGRGGPPRKIADMTMAIPPSNAQTDEKIALGKRLFFDKTLSSDRTVSCATCHDPEYAFADARVLAVGVGGRVGKRNSPTLVNRGFGRMQFWDGRAATLEQQALMPIADHNEMDLPLDDAVARLNKDASYTADFQTVFGAAPTSQSLGMAIASFVRTIRSGDSPYDRFMAGDTTALTAEQQAGMAVFRGKARCNICHSEPLTSDEQFYSTGIAWRLDANGAGAYVDDGRLAVTNIERDRGKFKVPTLREVARTAPYMHDGSLATLADVVNFYDGGGRSNPNLIMGLIKPIGLTSEEKQSLVKFLEALSGVVSGK